MAILKESVVAGNIRVVDSVLANTIQTRTLNVPASSGSTTFGPGSNGQVLKSNGTTVYWASDNNSVTGVKGNSEGSYRTGQVNLTAANVGAVAVAQGSDNAGKYLKVNDSGNVEAVALTTKAAATYNTSTSDQTIAASQYLTGVQTIKAVTTSGISAGNIKDGAVIKVGDANSATRIANVTGTFTDAATVSSGQTAAAAAQIRTGYSAWVDGAEVKGSIANLAATTYNTSTSDQTIASGKYISGTQTIKAVTTAGISAGNIKTGVTIKVGDANSATRIANVAGTFTASSTVSSGQTAAAAAQIRSGYSAWVDGAEVKGSIANGTITNNTSGGTSIATINRGSQIKISAGYYASDAYYTAQANSGTKTITASGNTTVDGYVTASVASASPTFKGGAISGTATASSSTASLSTSTNNSGVTIAAAASATRAVVQYNAAVAGWVSKAASADAYAASSATALTGTTYYLNGVTLSKPSSGSRTFTVTAPDGDSTQTFTFTITADGTSIAPAANGESF